MHIAPIQFRNALELIAATIGATLTADRATEIAAALRAMTGAPLDLGEFSRTPCGTYTFAAERFEDIMAEMHALHVQHWQETEKHRHGLQMSTESYMEGIEDERHGRVVQFTVRDAAGALVGNMRMYLRTSRHTGTRYAQEDTLFLVPAVRGGRLGLRFLQYVEDELHRVCGINEFRMDAKLVNRTADLLVRHLGYTPVATQLVKFKTPKE